MKTQTTVPRALVKTTWWCSKVGALGGNFARALHLARRRELSCTNIAINWVFSSTVPSFSPRSTSTGTIAMQYPHALHDARRTSHVIGDQHA